MIEKDKSLSLTVDEQFNDSRPSIDILFESATEVFGLHLLGVVLRGANNDGSYGLKAIKTAGGLAVIEDPTTAEVRTMPKAALDHFSRLRSKLCTSTREDWTFVSQISSFDLVM